MLFFLTYWMLGVVPGSFEGPPLKVPGLPNRSILSSAEAPGHQNDNDSNFALDVDNFLCQASN